MIFILIYTRFYDIIYLSVCAVRFDFVWFVETRAASYFRIWMHYFAAHVRLHTRYRRTGSPTHKESIGRYVCSRISRNSSADDKGRTDWFDLVWEVGFVLVRK